MILNKKYADKTIFLGKLKYKTDVKLHYKLLSYVQQL